MNIFICASKHNYDKISLIKEKLEKMGHIIVLPNTFENPTEEEQIKVIGNAEHSAFVKEMLKKSDQKIVDSDAILVLNFDKRKYKNYIGGAVFLEMFVA